MSLKKSKEDQYQQLVLEAKKLLVERGITQLKIAQIADKVCTIRHGGKGNYYTLTEFAKDVGVSFKSLSRWVITYRSVVAKIPEEIKTEKDWNKASKVSETLRKQRNMINKINGNKNSKKLFSEDLKIERTEVLRAFREMDENSKCLQYANDHLSAALYNLGKIDCYPKEDEKYLLNINQNVVLFIEMATKLQERTIYLMGKLKDKK